MLVPTSETSPILARPHKLWQNSLLATCSDPSLPMARRQFCHNLCLLAHRGELSLVLASQIPETLLSGICLATCSVLSLQVTRMQFLLLLCPPGNSSECPLVWASQIPYRLLSGICLAHSSGISLILARRHKMSQNCFLATCSELSL